MTHWKCLIVIAYLAVVWCAPLNLQWRNWKEKHGKFYTEISEEMYRRKVWSENQHFINEHNNNNNSFKLELNGFADMVGQNI